MSNIFRYFNIDRVLVSTIPTSSINSAIPVQAIEYQMDINDVVFMVRLEKIVEKLIKYGEKGDKGKMLDTLLDIKSLIEAACNVTIKISNYIDEIVKELAKLGIKAPQKEFEAIKKKFKKKEKKHKALAECINRIMHDEDDSLDELIFREMKKDKKKQEDEKEETEVEIPTQLIYGVTVALAGFFIMLIPFPGCADWGKRIIFLGLGACGTCICQKAEEDKKKKENKDENN